VVSVAGDGYAGGGGSGRRGQRKEFAAIARDVGLVFGPGEDGAEAIRNVRVVVEAQDCVGLGKRVGELFAVPLGEAADCDDRLGAAGVLVVGRGQEGVDRILLRGLDETAGVHHHGVRLGGVLDEPEATGFEPAGEFLGVDIVAGTAQRDQGDGGGWRSHHDEYDSPSCPPPNPPAPSVPPAVPPEGPNLPTCSTRRKRSADHGRKDQAVDEVRRTSEWCRRA